MAEAELVSTGLSAAASGDAFGFGRLLEHIGDGIDKGMQTLLIDGATAGELHVELTKLTDFYNSLSELHEKLLAKMQKLHERAVEMNQSHAGGHVPGAQRAWTAIAYSAGVAQHPNSLYGNLRAVDGLVLKHMAAIQHNAEGYASNENMAIAGFGKASTAATTTGSTAAKTGGKVHWE